MKADFILSVGNILYKMCMQNMGMESMCMFTCNTQKYSESG